MTPRPQPTRVAVRNAGDADQVKRAKESERARLERERNEDVAVWNTYAGRAFSIRLLALCGADLLSMASDPYFTAFNEGARNVGLKLKGRWIETAPDTYMLAMQEHLAREARELSAPEPKPPAEGEDADG